MGLPPDTPNGPNEVNADTACAPAPLGKHEAKATSPAGVGVIPPLAYGVLVLMICWLNPPDRKNLFLTQGPPRVTPANSLLSRGGLVSGFPFTSVSKFFWKLVM